jgi:hypothetical protein
MDFVYASASQDCTRGDLAFTSLISHRVLRCWRNIAAMPSRHPEYYCHDLVLQARARGGKSYHTL